MQLYSVLLEIEFNAWSSQANKYVFLSFSLQKRKKFDGDSVPLNKNSAKLADMDLIEKLKRHLLKAFVLNNTG